MVSPELQQREPQPPKLLLWIGKLSQSILAPLSLPTATHNTYTNPTPPTHPLQDAEKEERDSERVVPSATGRCCATTSRASPSLPSAVWHAGVESSASVA